jgi:hypothetical protein
MHAARWSIVPVLIGTLAACQGTPEAPAHPTWADVQPILEGNCNHCHGATAAVTGSKGPAVYRFDFFDMNDDVCGDASKAMTTQALAAASAALMKSDLGGGRPKMPPAPASPLHDWERETILRWVTQPVKGPPPGANRRPRIRVTNLPATVSTRLQFFAVVDDPDGDSVVGLVSFGGATFGMDHPGSFAVDIDMTQVPNGMQRLTATLCDGWASTTYDLGPIAVSK